MLEQFVNIVFGITLFSNAALFIPQALKLIRSKDPKSLSLVMFLGFNVGQIFSIWHSYYTKDKIFMIGSLATLITCGTITGLIIYYRNVNK